MMVGTAILTILCFFILMMCILFHMTDEIETHGLRGRRANFMI